MEVLDGDELYEWLAPLDMSKKARMAQTQRIAHITKMLIKHDISVCVSVQSPFEESRAKAREIIKDDRYFLSYMNIRYDRLFFRPRECDFLTFQTKCD